MIDSPLQVALGAVLLLLLSPPRAVAGQAASAAQPAAEPQLASFTRTLLAQALASANGSRAQAAPLLDLSYDPFRHSARKDPDFQAKLEPGAYGGRA